MNKTTNNKGEALEKENGGVQMRTWNIVALVLTITFAFSSISYAQEEKKTLGEKLSSAAETTGKVVEQGKAVYKGEKTGLEAVTDFTAEVSPTVAFWQSHQGFFQVTFGKYWGGKVFLCAFIILFILIMTMKNNNRGILFWILGVPLFYFVILRPIVFFVELSGSDSANIMGFIALGTLVVEIIIGRKFLLALIPSVREKGFKETWVMDPDNPTTPDSGESPTDGDIEFSVCTNPSCGAKKVLNGKCRMCGHKVEATDASDATPPAGVGSPAAAGSTSATTSTPATTPRPRTRVERREVRKNRRF